MLKFALIMLTGTFIASCSQIILKKAAEKEYPSKIAEYLNPMVMGAYIVFFGASLCSVLGYKKVPLSIGPILEATGYIWVAILGKVFLGEKISTKKALGLVIIIVGIIIAAFGV
ncbi:MULTISPECIES: EamA family transporter [Pseudobutyrivibrio]|uniref:Triose-phosphate Transporter family protein n=1 Tax=Pseudobutyrivibrio xylanivorans TaxID=185007 RepID=A0A1G5S0K1_PSEXY|nr:MULTISPECIES: EamA family transporter [Pseudobutyrivibrio]MDC7278760.1 EamA family transporter [Butyrivibrio fibrisolvens]SCZ79786.1 Triose-phosphate Transporter family protein [Pseudobutyrivibrio xylanivorans]